MADPMQQAHEPSSPDEIAFRLRNLAKNMAAGSGPVARDHQAWKRVEELAEAVAALRAAPEWQPIETAPLDKNVLMVWRPVDAQKRPWHVEVVIAQLSSYEAGSIWIAGTYQPASHVSQWMSLPTSPLAARPQGVSHG